MQTDITEKAMLVSLSISQWSARKHDKHVSREVNAQYGSNQDAGRFNKALATKEALKDIQAAVSAARAFHLEQTLPWGENGERLLPSRNYSDYSQQVRGFKEDFEQAVEKFITNYPEVIFEARSILGGLFNREDYPEPSEVRDKFAFRTVIGPIPQAQDFRVSLAADEVSAIQEEIEQRLVQSNAAATADLWKRLYEVVGHMVERLSDPDAIFRDSLIGNMVRLTELLPKLNLYDDPQLEAMRRRIETGLCSYAPGDLRKDKQARKQAASEASDVLAAMSGYMEAA